MQARDPLKVVMQNLKKQAVSNAGKSIAEVILDGTYTKDDIVSVLTSAAFPTNAMGDASPEERRYDSNTAIEEFARCIAPFLSDLELYRLTSMAVKLECLMNDTAAFRNASLAKALFKLEIERHQAGAGSAVLPDALKCNCKEFILELAYRNWRGSSLERNFNKFMSFNLGLPEAQSSSYFQEVCAFDAEEFKRQAIDAFIGKAPASDVEKAAFVRQFSIKAQPKSRFYKFIYNAQTKSISGYKPAYDAVTDIKSIDIANLEYGVDAATEYVWFMNDSRHDLNELREAKWVLTFPKGDASVNEAWRVLVELVERNVLFSIKASPRKEQFADQMISVYAAEEKNLFEIIGVFDILHKYGVLDFHMRHACNGGTIKYITDESTRLRRSAPSFTNHEIAELHKLYELRGTVSEELFAAKWQAFTHVYSFDCLSAAYQQQQPPVLPDGFVKTHFSSNEAEQRIKVVMTINECQQSINSELLDECLREVRQALTSNYKFSSAELLESGVKRLEQSMPKQSLLAGVFRKHPEIEAFQRTMSLLKQLVVYEKQRCINQVRAAGVCNGNM